VVSERLKAKTEPKYKWSTTVWCVVCARACVRARTPSGVFLYKRCFKKYLSPALDKHEDVCLKTLCGLCTHVILRYVPRRPAPFRLHLTLLQWNKCSILNVGKPTDPGRRQKKSLFSCTGSSSLLSSQYVREVEN